MAHYRLPVRLTRKPVKIMGKYLVGFFSMITSLALACDLPAPCSSAAQTVPFLNVVLSPNCKVNANYSFTDSTGVHPNIFCYENTGSTIGSFSWTYLGGCVPTTPLPVLLKTVGPLGAGERLADSVGSLVIQNTTVNIMVVSCVYGF